MHQKIEEMAYDDYIKNLFVSEKYTDAAQNFNTNNGLQKFLNLDIEPNDEEYISTIFNVNMNGFGFIKDEENNNIFFHYSTVTNRDFTELQAGMRVKYLREEDADRSKKEGTLRYRACKVTIID
jgi:cold shock CspA family protein